MKFEEVLPALREGKKIKHKSWYSDSYWRMNMPRYIFISMEELTSDDWEIIEEPKKPAKVEEVK